jgi:hypothetical protein
MSKFTVNMAVECYPDGEVLISNDCGETLVTMTADDVIASMIKHWKQCDWLVLNDMKVFANKILEAVEKEQ